MFSRKSKNEKKPKKSLGRSFQSGWGGFTDSLTGAIDCTSSIGGPKAKANCRASAKNTKVAKLTAELRKALGAQDVNIPNQWWMAGTDFDKLLLGGANSQYKNCWEKGMRAAADAVGKAELVRDKAVNDLDKAQATYDAYNDYPTSWFEESAERDGDITALAADPIKEFSSCGDDRLRWIKKRREDIEDYQERATKMAKELPYNQAEIDAEVAELRAEDDAARAHRQEQVAAVVAGANVAGSRARAALSSLGRSAGNLRNRDH